MSAYSVIVDTKILRLGRSAAAFATVPTIINLIPSGGPVTANIRLVGDALDVDAFLAAVLDLREQYIGAKAHPLQLVP